MYMRTSGIRNVDDDFFFLVFFGISSSHRLADDERAVGEFQKRSPQYRDAYASSSTVSFTTVTRFLFRMLFRAFRTGNGWLVGNDDAPGGLEGGSEAQTISSTSCRILLQRTWRAGPSAWSPARTPAAHSTSVWNAFPIHGGKVVRRAFVEHFEFSEHVGLIDG
jgi:hypothetical protein